MAWLDDEPIRDLNTMEDKVENSDPQSTPQVLPSFEEYTSPVTCLEEVEETLGTHVEVEPLDETQLKDLGLNTCNHDIPLSNMEVPSFDKLEPQPNPLPNFLSLDVSLGEERGPKPPIKPHSPDRFRMKEGLESKEVSPLGKELSLFDRPNEVERGRILEARRLEPILQQQISQRMAPSHHDGFEDNWGFMVVVFISWKRNGEEKVK
ncbi:hypothetical protein Tco_0765642 [Tanacetum coccineum]